MRLATLMTSIKLLALSGSLRKMSYNSSVLDAFVNVTVPGIELEIFKGLNLLPLFNPDLEDQAISAVESLKQAVGRADGLLIASPEYAHGISAVMKNALEWLVSGSEFINIPIALINTSPRASHAQVALREVLNTMSGLVVESACVSVPLLSTKFTSVTMLEDHDIRETLLNSLTEFKQEIINEQALGKRFTS